MAMSGLPVLPPVLVTEAVHEALLEDLGDTGDITSAATIPRHASATATFSARKPGVLAGLPLAEATFREVDASVSFESVLHDGDRIAAGAVGGPRFRQRPFDPRRRARRAELPLPSLRRRHRHGVRLSIESSTPRLASSTRVRPRPAGALFEKYAVRCGGGANHRFGLYDAILIKDNHIAVAGGVANAIRAVRAADRRVKIEVEVASLDQLAEALAEKPDIVMLDNMTLADMRAAVKQVGGGALLEASGNVTLDTVAAIAETGVDFISSGWITHSAPALDLGLDIVVV